VSSPNLIKHDQFPSRFLRNRRDLIVYLPPGYHQQPDRGYPVLYLHDGQNLFDGATSFIPGVDWHVGQTADALIRERRVEPLIIVGLYNAGKQRLGEYTPTRAPKLGGGRANRYAKFLLDEVRPFVQRQYRVAEGAERTARCLARGDAGRHRPVVARDAVDHDGHLLIVLVDGNVDLGLRGARAQKHQGGESNEKGTHLTSGLRPVHASAAALRPPACTMPAIRLSFQRPARPSLT